jgi:hypothetical protein
VPYLYCSRPLVFCLGGYLSRGVGIAQLIAGNRVDAPVEPAVPQGVGLGPQVGLVCFRPELSALKC